MSPTHNFFPSAVGVFLVCALLVMLAGCATPPQTRQLAQQPPADLPARKLLNDVPFYPQKAYQCGPAALAMLLGHADVDVTPNQLVSRVYVPAREGSFQVEMLAATRGYNRLGLEITPELANLLHWLDAGEPVLVLQNLGLSWYQKWHYAVVIGYDLKTMEIILHSGEIANYRVSFSLFERTWARGKFWGMAALKPGNLPFGDDPRRYLQAAAALEETVPQANLQAVWETGAQTWPGFPDLTMGLANHLYGAGNRQKAMSLYRKLVDKFPAYIPAYNNLATAQLESGMADKAIATARRGLEMAGGSHAFLEKTLASAVDQKNAAQ